MKAFMVTVVCQQYSQQPQRVDTVVLANSMQEVTDFVSSNSEQFSMNAEMCTEVAISRMVDHERTWVVTDKEHLPVEKIMERQ